MDSFSVPLVSSKHDLATQQSVRREDPGSLFSGDDDVLFWYADRLVEEDGIPIEFAYRIAQQRFLELDALVKEEVMDTPFYRHVAKFELGQVVATPGALEAIIRNGITPATLLNRHAQGDFGDLSEEDRQLNEEAITDGSRILSSYSLQDGTKIWIITEADRSSSCLLLPEEY